MRLLVAGGGTGGHLFPGLAVAEALLLREPGAAVLFVGTVRGIEARVVPKAGLPVEFIEVGTLKGQGAGGALRTALGLPLAVLQAARIVRRFRPDVVLGVGGYASGPVLAAARLLGCRTAIMEQNAVPGLTNRWLGRVVDRVFTAFEPAPGASPFPARKVVRTGNPIRGAFRALPSRPAAHDRRLHLLVFGGSAGARRINEAMVAALPGLAAWHGRLAILHQTGEGPQADVEAGYRAAGWGTEAAEVRAFIDDMAAAYAWADLVVCRAGAGTVAELTAVGRPALLVPYPFAADDHQEANARALVEAGAAVRVRDEELSGDRLAAEIAALAADPARRATMAAAARRLGEPAAADRLVDELFRLAGASPLPRERRGVAEPPVGSVPSGARRV
jgi:UDP-N-acetylglucosamine--N-acetylmuramyl-(pentapeptide) pyrophosphoryl-undecaprenol N-acetylglucosamine transferase